MKFIAAMLMFSGALFLSACSSAPPVPIDKIASVKTAIASAKDKEAHTYATLELIAAEKKLAEAEKLIAEEENTQAALVLDQALDDAKLAEAKADTARAEKQRDALRDAVDTLNKEMNR